MNNNYSVLTKLILLLWLSLSLTSCEEDEDSLQKPVADFTVDKTILSSTGSVVQFTDLSTNNPKKWMWDLGDGGIVSRHYDIQNPTHSYYNMGCYTVSLIVFNDFSSDTIIKTNFIVPEGIGESGTVSDYDGNLYKTIEIGDQCWMAENLKTTHYADGTEIKLVEDSATWHDLTISKDKAYCFYKNSASNANIYGALYNWVAVMNGQMSSDSNPSNVQGVCPDGWHVPSYEEWKELENYLETIDNPVYLGGERIDGPGGKLKEAGFRHWAYSSINATNISGFTSLPGGYRSSVYFGKSSYACYWLSTEYDNSNAWSIEQWNDFSINHISSKNKFGIGLSVRCIKN